MTRIKLLSVAMVAMFATAGVLAATSPAAVPTWFECAKTGTGNFSDKTCKTPAAEPGKGKYELKEGIGKGKKIKSKVTGDLGFIVKSPQGTFPIACGSEKGVATPALPNLEKEVNITLKKCTFVGAKCTTVGGKGVELKGEGVLDYVAEGTKVGLELQNALGPEQPLGTLECTNKGEEVVKAEMLGAVIGVQEGDINTVTKESTLTYFAQEQYGTHLFKGTEYKPSVNIVGFSPEGEEAAACFATVPKTVEEEEAQTACQEASPPHLILGEYCGKFVKGVLGEECTPPTYTGLTGFPEPPTVGKVPTSPIVIAQKGESLMIKA